MCLKVWMSEFVLWARDTRSTAWLQPPSSPNGYTLVYSVQCEEKRIKILTCYHITMCRTNRMNETLENIFHCCYWTGKYCTQFGCFSPVNDWQCVYYMCTRTAGTIALHCKTIASEKSFLCSQKYSANSVILRNIRIVSDNYHLHVRMTI